MIDYVIMPKADYQALCDAIRSKSGKTDVIKSGELQTEIMTLPSGGSSDDVRYVTFMNGDEFLFRKPVAVGDDCVDVLTKGLIETPTKESTVQYDYTYYGWGASDNGAADANILKNITEDKTVYAIYTSTLRRYTITYLDDDGVTILHTEQLAYGTVPSYKPAKESAIFTGWNTEPVAVTGDATYIATWEEFIGGNHTSTITWKLENGVLTLSGTGTTGTSKPWSAYTDIITSIVVEDGITGITKGLFSGCSNVESMTIPFVGHALRTTNTKPYYPFGYIFGESSYDGGVYTEQNYVNASSTWYRVYYYIPEKLKNVTVTGGYLVQDGFKNCANLESVTFGNKDPMKYVLPMFNGCTNLKEVTLPSNAIQISQSCFLNCTSLKSITIPEPVTLIYKQAFSGCTNLTSATFLNKSGWFVCDTTSATSGTTISVNSASTAATYLKSTYVDKHFKRT